MSKRLAFLIFFFNDTATTEIYTLSLHDALPISLGVEVNVIPVGRIFRTIVQSLGGRQMLLLAACRGNRVDIEIDRKSTRLNSSHLVISYAVFCLKKKQQSKQHLDRASDTQLLTS